MAQGSLSRRQLLKRSGVAGTAVLSGLSGCLDIGLFGGGSGNYESWLYAPDEVDRDHYSFTRVGVDEWVDHEDELDESVYRNVERFEERYDDSAIDLAEIEDRISFHGVTVITGSYDASSVKEEFEEGGSVDGTEYEGYTIYDPDEDDVHAVGVGDDAVVWSSESHVDDPIDLVELAIDTRAGEEDRYADESEEHALLTEPLGGEAMIWGKTHDPHDHTDAKFGRFENAVASGLSADFDGETSTVRAAFVYEDAADVDVDDVETWMAASSPFDDSDAGNIETDGRTVTLDQTMDTDDVSVGFF